MESRQRAIEVCGCPCNGAEPLAAPRCAPDWCLADAGLLFIKLPVDNLGCNFERNYGSHYYCTCKKRIRLYQDYGI